MRRTNSVHFAENVSRGPTTCVDMFESTPVSGPSRARNVRNATSKHPNCMSISNRIAAKVNTSVTNVAKCCSRGMGCMFTSKLTEERRITNAKSVERVMSPLGNSRRTWSTSIRRWNHSRAATMTVIGLLLRNYHWKRICSPTPGRNCTSATFVTKDWPPHPVWVNTSERTQDSNRSSADFAIDDSEMPSRWKNTWRVIQMGTFSLIELRVEGCLLANGRSYSREFYNVSLRFLK